MKSWMDLIVVVTPVILSPIIAWLLSHTGLPSDEARMNYLLKRLDLIARLHQMQTDLKDNRLKEMFDTELEMCKKQMTFHRPDMTVQEDDMGSEPKSWVGKFFLYGPSRNIKQRVFKGLFYFFLAIFALVLLLLTMPADGLSGLDKSSIIIGSFFYLFLAILFRAMAKAKPIPRGKTKG